MQYQHEHDPMESMAVDVDTPGLREDAFLYADEYLPDVAEDVDDYAEELQRLIDTAIEADSYQDEAALLRAALSIALSRWPGVVTEISQ